MDIRTVVSRYNLWATGEGGGAVAICEPDVFSDAQGQISMSGQELKSSMSVQELKPSMKAESSDV